jgi:hypothetical protein
VKYKDLKDALESLDIPDDADIHIAYQSKDGVHYFPDSKVLLITTP